jgi:hypothetical protein
MGCSARKTKQNKQTRMNQQNALFSINLFQKLTSIPMLPAAS